MATIDNIKTELIDKILSINNIEFLEALGEFISLRKSESEVVELSNVQKEILEISEKEIKLGDVISHDLMNKRNQEWLNAL